VNTYRREFLDACVEFADALRIREKPGSDSLGERILEDSGKLKSVRNQIIDWVLLESEIALTGEFEESLLKLLEDLRELKSRPPEVNSWNDMWFEARSVFVYETFLYIIASLLKRGAYSVLHEIFTSHYLRPKTERYSQDRFDNFGVFHGSSQALQSVLAPNGQRLYSPEAELIKRQADREDFPFSAVTEAELLVLLMAFISVEARWYPGTILYRSQEEFPFFVRATQHKHFLKLAAITGITNADDLRNAVVAGHERLNVKTWYNFPSYGNSFWDRMNMDKLDTLK
jgi:hypothetical protein